MYKVKRFLKKLFTPVSIMMIPHDSKRTINFRVPSIGILLAVFLWLAGTFYVVTATVDTIEYHQMKNKVAFYSSQFSELQTAMNMIMKADSEFRRLLSFGSKEQILENVDAKKTVDNAGSLDMEQLREQIKKTTETVIAVSDYLREQKDLEGSLPKGWPVVGRVTSHYGHRQDPKYGGQEFHAGIDISVPKGTPIRTTADGVVSFSGWSAGNGNLVVVEHGMGYSTLYAHNSSNKVAVGNRVKRGAVIALAGATGYTTGSHLHYEVWVNGKAVNPRDYIWEDDRVSEKK
ncbi:MAG TPA: M23 family metallopeptidase [Dissulfurispiraceae bacterium]|nr:M23 family metallopeptidase [Dissulfurispiraceae bacterium]